MLHISCSLSTLRCVASTLSLLTLAGCAQITYNKTVDVWEAGKKRLVGMRESDLRQCAGEPNSEQATRDGSRLRYGFAQTFTFASAYCILNLDVSDGLVRRFNVESQNPGGLGDGSNVCAAIVDECFGDGTLENEMRNAPGTLTAGRIVGDLSTQSAAYSAAGRQARDAGLASSMGLAAGLSRNRTGSPTVVEPAAPVRPERQGTVESGPSQPQRTAANSINGTGATTTRQPAAATSGTSSPTPEASRSTSAAAESAPKVTLDSQLISNGTFNLWRIKLTNPSSSTVRCFVSATYGYADPNGTGKIVWDSATRTVTIPARSSGNADYGMKDRNIQTDSYRLLSCDRA